MTPAGFPHSDTPGSTLGCQLPRAYRRLLRPSSALDAKASTMCPSQLVTHTTNPHHPTHTHGRHPDPRHPQDDSCHRNDKEARTPPHENTREMTRAGSAHNTLQRCSRPLSRSQTTTPHQTPPPPTGRNTNRPGQRPLPGVPGTTRPHPHSGGPPHGGPHMGDRDRPAPPTREGQPKKQTPTHTPTPRPPGYLDIQTAGAGGCPGLIPQNPNSVPPPELGCPRHRVGTSRPHRGSRHPHPPPRGRRV